MAIADTLKRGFATMMFERPARNKSIQELNDTLHTSWQKIDNRISFVSDTEKHQKVMRHVIGIERWGQSRLRTLLGEPFQRDEYDGYQPEVGLNLDQQRQLFKETREETINIAKQLQEKGVASDSTAVHNDFGDITIRAWLRYLEFHATQEMKRIR